MINPSFEIAINGVKLTTANVDAEFGVLSAMITWVKRADGSESLQLSTTGLDSEQSKLSHWPKQNLNMGDVVTISISEDKAVTEPLKTKKPSNLENMLRTYNYLKEELKDHII
ncbi:hypothetical protein ASE92_12005 [Pedobacter sp. Leaf41]|uniref:hypothetical protein n=1 Tax=Pedobacter sp. Leaf41 TaxID=1736218 RepID=UPI00070329B0|nr:hypothetical protein [Pedobacter sp. Leaf41]KQN34328.1 hypothetical protein ASE92_12005 [Pedobacter sp. Leaf41]